MASLISFLRGTLLLTAAVMPFAPAAHPQPPPRHPQQATPATQLRVRVEVVNVDVAVSDARGNFVRDLKRENFRILEEGVERPITYFAPVETPAMVMVLVETSPAVLLIFRQHVAAVRALLEGLGAEDWVALATYDQSARVVESFTQNRSVIRRELTELPFSLGPAELHFFKSVATALDWLGPVTGRKALVALTTGLDTQQPRQWDTLAEKLRASEVVVFPVALGGSLREFRKTKTPPVDELGQLSFEQADRDLEEMARLTGGRAYFPQNALDFEGIYREISAAVRHTYSLGFAPRARDGKFHHIEVQVVDEKGRVIAPKKKGGYRVRVRQGYVAPAQ